MEQQRPGPAPRRVRRLGVVSGVIAISLLGAGAVAAQSPSTSPGASTPPSTQQTPSTTMPGTGRRGYGRGMGPGVSPQMRPGPGGQPWTKGGQPRGMGPRMGQGFEGRPGSGQGGFGGFGRGSGPMVDGGRQLWLMGRSSVSVSAITAPVISLVTDDGWTRDIDTTGVVITRGGQTITLDDVSVGDDVRVAQTRNADGSWTVTGIEVQLATVQGTVASVATDSFSITQADGTTVTVRVSDTTQWLTRRGTTTGLSSLTVGQGVVAAGVRAADGSIDATAVGVRGIAPMSPAQPTVPSASPTPGATQG